MAKTPTPAPQQGGSPAAGPQQDQGGKPAPQQGTPPVIRDWAAI